MGRRSGLIGWCRKVQREEGPVGVDLAEIVDFVIVCELFDNGFVEKCGEDREVGVCWGLLA